MNVNRLGFDCICKLNSPFANQTKGDDVFKNAWDIIEILL